MPVTSDMIFILIFNNIVSFGVTYGTLLRTGHFYCKCALCKIMKSYHSIFLIISNVPNELEIQLQTMTLNHYLPFQSWHLVVLRTGQSGVTDFIFLTQSHSILLYGHQELKRLLIVKLQPLSVLFNHSIQFLGEFQVSK